MAVTIIKNKDLIFDTEKYDVILVGTNIYNLLSQGFQSKMAVKYPQIEEANNQTPYADRRKFGKRLTIDGTPIISLMYIAGYPHKKRDVLDYNALEHCLQTANQEFKGKRVASTFLGTSPFDGNSQDKERCMSIIENSTPDIDLTIYDYIQLNRRVEIAQHLKKFNVYKKKRDWAKYYELVRNKKKIIASLFLRH